MLNGMKKFVIKGMQPKETLEERIKRLASCPLPGVAYARLSLFYCDMKASNEAYTATLDMRLTDNEHQRQFFARCASFDKALEQVQLYENGLIAGKQFIENPELIEFRCPEAELHEQVKREKGPFETRAEFTTSTDVLGKFGRADKKGKISFEPRLVSDLPRLRHGIAVCVPLKRYGEITWMVDWFDYACYNKEDKEIIFACIHDGYTAIYPLDPYISYAIDTGIPIPNAHRLWLKKTIGDVKAALKNDKEKVYTE